MCVVAGDALSVGAQSALADIRGLGVPLGWERGEDAHLQKRACMHDSLVCLSFWLEAPSQFLSHPPTPGSRGLELARSG